MRLPACPGQARSGLTGHRLSDARPGTRAILPILWLRGISDIEAANAFAPEFIADYNRRFARDPRSERVLYVLDPTEAAGAARGQRVGIEERKDGSLSFWHGEHELLATAFPKDHATRQGDVVDNKRLSAALDFIKERQRERTEAKVAKKSTTKRNARLLRAGTPRRPTAGSSAQAQS